MRQPKYPNIWSSTTSVRQKLISSAITIIGVMTATITSSINRSEVSWSDGLSSAIAAVSEPGGFGTAGFVRVDIAKQYGATRGFRQACWITGLECRAAPCARVSGLAPAIDRELAFQRSRHLYYCNPPDPLRVTGGRRIMPLEADGEPSPPLAGEHTGEQPIRLSAAGADAPAAGACTRWNMTRTALLATVGLLCLCFGGTCLPLELNPPQVPASEKLAITVPEPNTDRSVAQGDSVNILWNASNLTGAPAYLSFILESRDDLSRRTLVDRRELDATGMDETQVWNTASYKGRFAVIGHIEAGGLTREYTAKGIITVDAPPTFVFTSPTGDASYQLGADTPLKITWTGGDETATARIGLDPDTDHTNNNEIFIKDVTLTDPPAAGSLDWTGQDESSNDVEPGTYNLFARVSDSLNPVLFVEGAGQITVLAKAPAEPNSPEILEPNVDTEFRTEATLSIKYKTRNASDDVLVDLKIDTDDNHANGNEKTILSQLLVKANTDPNVFAWNGSDSTGVPVSDGIYRLLLVVSGATGTPTTTESKALVFRRSTEHEPLIALVLPAATTKVNPGDFVNIKWRDNDPNGAATIRLTVSTSSTPGGTEPKEILSGRPSAPEGVQTTFNWQVNSSFAPGTYYIFGEISSGNTSLAPGRVIIQDPNSTTGGG